MFSIVKKILIWVKKTSNIKTFFSFNKDVDT